MTILGLILVSVAAVGVWLGLTIAILSAIITRQKRERAKRLGAMR
jgi:hypothetical protein